MSLILSSLCYDCFHIWKIDILMLQVRTQQSTVLLTISTVLDKSINTNHIKLMQNLFPYPFMLEAKHFYQVQYMMN